MLHNLKNVQILISNLTVKGLKLEIFGSGVFTQIRPVRVDNSGIKLKNSKSLWLWIENRHFVLFGAVCDRSQKFPPIKR
jgi:hypothetical protein